LPPKKRVGGGRTGNRLSLLCCFSTFFSVVIALTVKRGKLGVGGERKRGKKGEGTERAVGDGAPPFKVSSLLHIMFPFPPQTQNPPPPPPPPPTKGKGRGNRKGCYGSVLTFSPSSNIFIYPFLLRLLLKRTKRRWLAGGREKRGEEGKEREMTVVSSGRHHSAVELILFSIF